MIVTLKRQGLNCTAIAKAIGRHRCTIYREFKRNTCWHMDGSYRPSKAQRRTRAIKLMSRMPKQFKTITADNGTEFHQYKVIEHETNCPFYFANPHHS